MANHVARPSRKAFRALSRAGYAYKTTARGGTTVTGRIVKRARKISFLRFTTSKIVPLKRR